MSLIRRPYYSEQYFRPSYPEYQRPAMAPILQQVANLLANRRNRNERRKQPNYIVALLTIFVFVLLIFTVMKSPCELDEKQKIQQQCFSEFQRMDCRKLDENKNKENYKATKEACRQYEQCLKNPLKWKDQKDQLEWQLRIHEIQFFLLQFKEITALIILVFMIIFTASYFKQKER